MAASIAFLYIVNLEGKTRFSRHYDNVKCEERVVLESDVAKKCLSRKWDECSFFDYRHLKIIYRRFGNLTVIIGTRTDDDDQNELALLEFVNLFVETLDVYFDHLTEAKIVLNVDRVHLILQEMVSNGQVVVTPSIKRILTTINATDKLLAT